MILDTSFKSLSVLLSIIKFVPASARAIAQAFPKPLPAPVTRAVFFLSYIFLSTSNNQNF